MLRPPAPAVRAGDDTAFANRIVRWQLAFGRTDLPWQATRDRYRIWVSEIMLQQTRVATVIPYYTRFVSAFPDVRGLAAAPAGRVLELWSGLGYYTRARNLHGAARAVVANHAGELPATPAALAALPGIGRSTAAAICVFSAGLRAAILDGNVKRVLARHAGVEGHPGQARVAARLWEIAESRLPEPCGDADEQWIRAYTQGLMDLGATLCTRRNPACDRCPVRADCVARRENRAERLPSPRPKRALAHREIGVLVVRSDAGILVERRPAPGIWGGLWSLPEVAGTEAALAGAPKTCGERFGLRVDQPSLLPPIRHAFTHFCLTIRPALLRVIGTALPVAAEPGSVTWLPPAQTDGAALPAPIKRLLRGLEVQ